MPDGRAALPDYTHHIVRRGQFKHTCRILIGGRCGYQLGTHDSNYALMQCGPRNAAGKRRAEADITCEERRLAFLRCR